jgi:hypothetical protein
MATQVVRINLAPHEFRRHEPLQINRHGWFGTYAAHRRPPQDAGAPRSPPGCDGETYDAVPTGLLRSPSNDAAAVVTAKFDISSRETHHQQATHCWVRRRQIELI